MKLIIEFLLFEHALGLDITGPLEVFNMAGVLLAAKGRSDEGYQAVFSGLQKGPVVLSSGLTVLAEKELAQGSAVDILLVPGGPGIDRVIEKKAFLEALKFRLKDTPRIVSVCNGAFLLAEAGILNGKKATTHWCKVPDFLKRFPGVLLDPDAIYIQDGNVFTSAGVTSGIDLSLAIVEQDFGPDLALETARMLVLYYKRPGGQNQFSAPLSAGFRARQPFRRLHQWLLCHLDQAISVETMAEKAGMSPRNFSRKFKQVMGKSPALYIETLRIEKAKELLSSGKDSLTEIAFRTGFKRDETLRRVFLKKLGVCPNQYKKLFGR